MNKTMSFLDQPEGRVKQVVNPGFRNHPCDLPSQLEREPAVWSEKEFICKRCGAESQAEESLCDPAPE